MQAGNLAKCLDKQICVVLSHVFHQSRTVKRKNFGIKRHSPLLSFQNNFTNILNNILEKQIVWDPCAEIKQFLQENISGSNTAILTLMNIFQINRNTARYIFSKYPVFKEIPKKSIIVNYEKLINCGMSLSLIQDNVILLAEDSNILQKKIEYVQRIVNNIDHGVCFFCHNPESLYSFIKFSAEDINSNSSISSISYFQEQLQIQNEDLCNIISKYLYMATYYPEQLVKNIKLLLDYKVSIKSVLKYDWPMHHADDKMKARLAEYSKSTLLLPIKPWILNCSEEIFNRKIEAANVSKSKIRQLSLLIDFLSEKSGYNIIIKYKIRTLKIHSKLSDFDGTRRKISLFLNEGYDYHDIIWSIKVLTLSESIIIDRFQALQAVKHKAPFLDVLLLSNEAFVNFVNSKR